MAVAAARPDRRRPRCRTRVGVGSPLLVFVVVLVGFGAVTAPAGAAAQPRVPVPGRVTDPFRPPAHPYGPGNRGVELATRAGAAVVAPVAGRVSFAGQVAGMRAVTVHDPSTGRRFSVSFLASVLVRTGDHVVQGQRIGDAGPVTHVGVRDAAGTYLDPMVVFAARRPRLVPGGDDGAFTRIAGRVGAALRAALAPEGVDP